MHAADLSSWFKVEASVVSVEATEATISLRLLFWDVGHGAPSWKALRWSDLGEMHGRRVHASVVSFDLHAAWHVHPPESTAASASELTIVLGLPPRREGDEAALQARLPTPTPTLTLTLTLTLTAHRSPLTFHPHHNPNRAAGPLARLVG